MNSLERLNHYLAKLEWRLRLAAWVRGAALASASALGATLLLAPASNAFAFAGWSVTAARVALFLVLALAVGFGLAAPLILLNRRRVARRAEREFPAFGQRLLTLAERRDSAGEQPFLELLAADTLEVASGAEAGRIVPSRRLLGLGAAGAAAVTVLVWLIAAGPGFWGYGAALLWAGTPRGGLRPFYDISVWPGDQTVRRKADQLVKARLVGFQAARVRLLARYGDSERWEEAEMRPEARGSGYEFLFAGLAQSVAYQVEAGGVRSKLHRLTVSDLPSVRRLRVTYHFPAWTGMAPLTENGGDVRAVEGTEAEIAVETDRPLSGGMLALDDRREVALAAAEGNWQRARLKVERDGLYHVAVVDRGGRVRLTEDFFIEAQREKPPEVRISRPGRDPKVNPVEEVTIEVAAEDDFGLENLELRYSVNGGAERAVPLGLRKGDKSAQGSATLYLEDFKLAPGDVVSFYGMARDARSAGRTDMFFAEAQPFEREYSQSQQSGGGGGGEGGEQEGRISQRQKEIISATWNQLRDRPGGKSNPAENARFLSDMQSKLRDQARSLAQRMRSRQLAGANQEFQSFAKDMETAAEAMGAAADKLKGLHWQEALAPEQRALQHLLRAEATFRQIQVAFGSRGSGRGGGSGRDLENLFDLELDTEKNQYETGQQQASGGQRAREMDEALQKLEQLARRQQELAREQARQQQTPEQRWQQEILRREAEELQRRMEELARGRQSGSQSAGEQRLQQSLERLEQATRDMRRAAGTDAGGNSRGGAESQRAAERLQEARDLLGGMRRQETSARVDDLAQRAGRLSEEQKDYAERLKQTYSRQQPGTLNRPDENARRQAEQFAKEKEGMAQELERLERDMQRAVREMPGSQREASSKVRDALGEMQQDELGLRMRYGAEWIRRGMGAYVWNREEPVTQGLARLSEQLRQAQGALNREGGSQEGPGGALARVERLRARMQQRMSGGESWDRSTAMNLGDREFRGGGGNLARELSQLRQELRGDPEMEASIDQLLREVRRLDPSRFPGNPKLLSQILPGVEQLEILLRRKLEGGQVRSGAGEKVPEGYSGPVAEYFRRLSKP